MFEQEMLEVSPDESQQSTFNPFEKFIGATERRYFPSLHFASFAPFVAWTSSRIFSGTKMTVDFSNALIPSSAKNVLTLLMF